MTIEELRLEKGLSREAFAERLGIDLSALEDYESGKRSPSAKDLDAIKDIFSVELSSQAPVEATEPEAAETVEAAVAGEAVEAEAAEEAESGEAVEAAADEAEAGEAEAGEAVEAPADEAEAGEAEAGEAVEAPADEAEAGEAKAGEAVEAPAGETEAGEAEAGEAVEASAGETEAGEAEAGETVEEAIEEAVAEVMKEASAEEAALIAAAEKEARKAAKKARKAEKLAARQKADEEATQRVIDIISALSGSVDLDDRDAVAAARDAYDSLTDDQELLIPGDVLRLLFGAEQRIEDAEEAAAREAAKQVPIEACEITVKDVAFTGKKLKKPSVKVVWGDTKLERGEDYSLKYDKKTREIGLYLLTVKGKGRFTGSVKVPFYVVPKASEYARLLGSEKQAAKAWKLLENIEGFQIEYSRNKDFSDSKKAKIREPKDLAKVLSKLKAGKKYYLRVRLFATVKKKHYYSEWSEVNTVKL